MRVIFLTQQPPQDVDGAQQQRCLNPQRWLRDAGLEVEVLWTYARHADLQADVVVFHRAQWDGATARLMARARASGALAIYETDDLLFDPDAGDYLRRIGRGGHADRVDRRRAALLACDAAIVSTEPLAQAVLRLGKPVWTVPNGLGPDFLTRAEAVGRSKSCPTSLPVLGYFSGSSSHERDFGCISGVLVDLLREHADLRLVVVGALMLPPELTAYGTRVERRGMVPYVDLPDEIGRVDVSLAPLEMDEPFCQAKSALKYIEAAACGVATVASATNVFSQAIEDGRTGHVARSADDWHRILEALLARPGRAWQLGQVARESVAACYAPESSALRWRTALSEILQQFSGLRRRRPLTAAALSLRDRAGAVLDWSRAQSGSSGAR